MVKYQVYANDRRDSEHCGLVAACTHARREAAARSGVMYAVQFNGREVYTAEVRGGKLEAWML